MSPQGVLSVEESATGIVNVTIDPATENGEFYQVQNPRKIAADNSSGMEPSTPGKPNVVAIFLCFFLL